MTLDESHAPQSKSRQQRRISVRAALLPLIYVLTGCNSASTVYDSGPWGRSSYLDPARPVYSGPWLPPPRYPVIEEIYTAPSPVRSAGPEPMEPIGAWASRGVAPPPPEADEILDGPFVSSDHSSAKEHGRSSAVVSKSAPEEQSGAPAAKRFTALTGAWTAREGGRRCRLQLSSVPSLDLYKASSAQCSNKALQEVNAWSVREGNLLLFSRGRVVARLKENNESFTGTLEGSGTPVNLTR